MENQSQIIQSGREVKAPAWHQEFLRLCFVSFTLMVCAFGLLDESPPETVMASQQSPSLSRAIVPAAESRSVGSELHKQDLSSYALAYAALPLRFEENIGQLDDAVKFVAHGRNYTAYLTDKEAALSICPASVAGKATGPVRMKLVGSQASQGRAQGEEELTSRSNYFVGSDQSRWRTNVRRYGRVSYRSVYPNIDLIYYGANQSELEFDFVVGRGGDPRQIRIAYEGTGEIQIDSSGALVLDTPCGPIRQHRPNVYQEIAGKRQTVAGEYIKAGPHEARFLIGDYDRLAPVVIDPIIAASSYLGGSSGELASGVAIDSAGDVYIVGITNSTDFPGATGYQKTNNGGGDVFIAKVADRGTRLVFSTYLGGSNQDFGGYVALDPNGGIYVAGHTFSKDFPTKNAVQGTLKGLGSGFLTKIGSLGDTVEFSTYLGGFALVGAWGTDISSTVDYTRGLAVDPNGNPYVVLKTSAPWIDELTTPGVMASKRSGDFDVDQVKKEIANNNFSTIFNLLGNTLRSDAYLVKFNPSGTLFYGTYLGGDSVEPYGLAVDSGGNAYITGDTLRVPGQLDGNFGFPIPGPAAMGTFQGGGHDSFVVKINAFGTARLYATFIGGTGNDFGRAIAVDRDGQAYVTGGTDSSDFPVINGYQAGFGGDTRDAFVTKVSATGDHFLYSTFLGGSGWDEANAIAIDTTGSAYVVGLTHSANFPAVRELQGCDGSAASGTEYDAFITKLNPNGDNLMYSSCLGGKASDAAEGVAFGDNSIYITGWTDSVDFPTKQPFQAVGNGGLDAFITRVGEPGYYLR